MHACTHARTHARTHVRTHTDTHSVIPLSHFHVELLTEHKINNNNVKVEISHTCLVRLLFKMYSIRRLEEATQCVQQGAFISSATHPSRVLHVVVAGPLPASEIPRGE